MTRVGMASVILVDAAAVEPCGRECDRDCRERGGREVLIFLWCSCVDGHGTARGTIGR